MSSYIPYKFVNLLYVHVKPREVNDRKIWDICYVCQEINDIYIYMS